VKCIRVRFAAIAIFCAFAAGMMPSASRGGLVAASEPVTGATVFLKNQKTKSIRSYTSAKDGRFHFAQVNMSDDYDLWAEKDNRKTAVKTVSSWDTRKEFEVELKLK
jgi:hypothetical protein